jgi:phosphate-selective porin
MAEKCHGLFILLGGLLLLLLSVAALNAQQSSGALPPTEPGPKKFDWSSYFQVRYTGLEQAPDLYSLRRFKVTLFGQPNPHVEYYIQGIFKDGNRSNTDGRAYPQEAWIEFTRWRYAHITIGQFKPPFGMERFTSDAEIFTIDRSEATDHLVPNGALGSSFTRDRGIQVDSWVAQHRLYYAFGVFDGNGANEPFQGNGPLFAGRIFGVLHRSSKNARRRSRLAAGGAFSTRNVHHLNFSSALPGTASLGYDRFSGRDTRLNLEASADYGPASFRGEYFYAWFDSNRQDLPSVHASGFYVQFSYRFILPLQAVTKYERFDPNRSFLDRNDVRWTTLGVNWYVRENRIRLSADYIFKNEARNSFANNAFELQFQLFLH